jgi:tetratricopeptide (TPR) repeat protein
MLKKTVIFLLLAVLLLYVATVWANDALHERAKNLYDVGDYRAALNLYERILAQNPDDGTAVDLSAWCLRYLGKLKNSEEMFEKALTLLHGEDTVWVFIGLGEIYLDGKLYEKATPRFQEALKAAPNNPEAVERASRGIDLAQKAQEVTARKTPLPTTELTDSDERQKDALLSEQNVSPVPDMDSELMPEPERTQDAPASDSSAIEPKTTQPQEAKSQKTPPREAKNPPKPKKSVPSKETPNKPAQAPPRYETVYGVTLGMNIEEAIAQLKKDGHSISGDSFVKKGKTYYSIEGFPAVLPSSLTMNAASRHFYVTAYNEAVLSVIAQLDYDETRSFEELKNTLWQELPSLTGIQDARGVKTADNIFSYEIGAALSNTYGIWMYVTDKANGTCRLEIEHVDLVNFSHYWMAGSK